MRTRVGSVDLPNPVLTASGTAGHGAELAAYFPLGDLGAVVVKSLHADPWPGNPAPRVHQTPAGMINSVGLQGPGVEAWVQDELPDLIKAGARVVVSVWGHTVDDYRRAAAHLGDLPPQVLAVEANLSCPNLEGGKHMFATSAEATAETVEAVRACGVPVWAKLTPNVTDIVPIAAAAHAAGAEAVTLINTVLGMAIDIERRAPLLGGGTGGVSGPAIRPVAVRAVYQVREAIPDLAIVGAGGVASGRDAVEMLMAGANAVEVGTATFADPAAPARVARELALWCSKHGVPAVTDLVAAAHAPPAHRDPQRG